MVGHKLHSAAVTRAIYKVTWEQSRQKLCLLNARGCQVFYTLFYSPGFPARVGYYYVHFKDEKTED